MYPDRDRKAQLKRHPIINSGIIVYPDMRPQGIWIRVYILVPEGMYDILRL